MFLPLLAASGNLFSGNMTHDYYVGGGDQAHGYGAVGVQAAVALREIGSITGNTASDGSGYTLSAIQVVNVSGGSTYIAIHMPGTGGSETATSVWTTLAINGVTLSAASMSYAWDAADEMGVWYLTGSDPLSLYAVADETVLPYVMTPSN